MDRKFIKTNYFVKDQETLYLAYQFLECPNLLGVYQENKERVYVN